MLMMILYSLSCSREKVQDFVQIKVFKKLSKKVLTNDKKDDRIIFVVTSEQNVANKKK